MTSISISLKTRGFSDIKKKKMTDLYEEFEVSLSKLRALRDLFEESKAMALTITDRKCRVEQINVVNSVIDQVEKKRASIKPDTPAGQTCMILFDCLKTMVGCVDVLNACDEKAKKLLGTHRTRVIIKSSSDITIYPASINSPEPINVAISEEDGEIVITSKPQPINISTTRMLNGLGTSTTIVGEISGGVFISGNCIGCSFSSQGSSATDDTVYKTRWEQMTSQVSYVEISGTGNVSLNPLLIAKEIMFNLSGKGNLSIMASAEFDKINVNLTGMGNIDLADSKVGEAVVALSGIGNVNHFHVSKKASLRVTGRGNIRCMSSEGAEISQRVTGSGYINVAKTSK